MVCGEGFAFDAIQMTFAAYLAPCKDIVQQHTEVWFKRKRGVTSRMLAVASRIVDGLHVALTYLNDLPKLKNTLYDALDGRTWTDVPRAIRAVRGASVDEKELVVAHRNQLVNNLMTFFDRIRFAVFGHRLQVDEDEVVRGLRELLDQLEAAATDYDADADVEEEEVGAGGERHPAGAEAVDEVM